MMSVLSPNGPADGPPDLQVTAGLPPQVCIRLRAGGWLRQPNLELRTQNLELKLWNFSSEFKVLSFYFEYSSTISCSCTGRLICSRVGIDMIRPVIVVASNESHPGMPRPLTSSIACSSVGFFCVRPST